MTTLSREERELLVNRILEVLDGKPTPEVMSTLVHVTAIAFRSLDLDLENSTVLFAKQVLQCARTLKPGDHRGFKLV